MKLNRAWLVAAAMATLVGAVSVVGFASTGDEGDEAEVATTEQASATGDEAATTADVGEGVDQYARHLRRHHGRHHRRVHRAHRRFFGHSLGSAVR